MNKLSVGQKIYILTESSKILPGVVLEEVATKKISGISLNYKIAIGPQEKRKILDLDKTNNIQVFSTIDEIKNALLTEAQNFVLNMCKQALSNSNEWYNDIFKQPNTNDNNLDSFDEALENINNNSNETITQNTSLIEQRKKMMEELADPELFKRDEG